MPFVETKLNPNYPVLSGFPREYTLDTQKLQQLAIDIGNCILKVSAKPSKIYMRKLKKYFLKTNWFKKVRIIRDKLYLFRRSGRFAVIVTRTVAMHLSQIARKHKKAKLEGAQYL
ncbi:MAG: hypothetical protein M3Q64_00175 [bacterium]|nr:hypothetical protein [bacterium]